MGPPITETQAWITEGQKGTTTQEKQAVKLESSARFRKEVLGQDSKSRTCDKK